VLNWRYGSGVSIDSLERGKGEGDWQSPLLELQRGGRGNRASGKARVTDLWERNVK
jgi:hypothetical protein